MNCSGVSAMSCCCPLITCRLTDRSGNVLCPFDPGAILYTALPLPCGKKMTTVAAEGYVSVYSDEKRISPPIPFCMLRNIRISAPKGSRFVFLPRSFHCWAVPHCCGKNPGIERIELLNRMETAVFVQKAESLLVPQVDPCMKAVGRVCIFADRVFDGVRFCSGCCISYKNAELRAELSQYNAVSDGVKRTYRNSDELKKYGDRGILSPAEVSYYNVFVNGVLQPKPTYLLRKGELTFTTQDVPSKGQAVMILFVTWRDIDGGIMKAADWQYNAVSDGVKKIYTDQDEIREYGKHGIPSPCEVSYFNLFINGVLQPKRNYLVKRGVLELTTSDAPSRGAPVVLESIVIQNPEGRIFHADAYNYSSRSDGGKIYTDRDAVPMYGPDGIPDPDAVFYQNLFVNAVLQPGVNYRVQKGCLVLVTKDDPTVGAPITLQSVGCACEPRCETQMSDAALARWEKVYSCSGDPCDPRPHKQDE